MKLTIIAFFGVLVAGFLTSLAYAEELGNKNTHTTKCECSYGEWTESACIATNGACGSGQKTKTRQCVCPSNYKGKPDCPSGSDETVTISCTASCCSWVPSDWTDCKNGYQTQNYSCVCQPGAPADSKCSDSAPSSQTRPCCSWGDWTNYQNCSVNCGGGQSIRYRPCVCGTGDLTPVPQPPKDCKSGGYDSHYKPPSSSTPIANYCDGSAMESVPCNNFSCCTWGNYSEWSDCVNCGKNRTRYAICNCTNPLTYTSLLCPLQNSSFDSMLNMTLFCEGPQPMESAPCPDCNTTTTSNCTFDNWSNWTQCSSFCGGFQYRRQLCTCPEDDNSTCTEDYTDSRCVGIPQTETRPCNISCCSWVWTENWSQCNMENHCCGNGTQWRRPVCQCDGNIADDSSCSYAGVPPLNETRVCSSKPCCQLGPLQPINCSLLAINSQNMPDYCITPWSERYCQCPDATGNNYTTANFSQCNVDYSRIPISYNRSSDLCGDPAAYPAGSITCSQYNSTTQCISWQIDFDQTTGDLLQIHDANTTAIGECLYSTEYCWDGWTDWSECCGSCSSSTQWRRQTSSGTYSTCSVPPAYEVRACNLTGPCCEWVYDDSKQWSNCSVLCGNGEQWRFPYNCSCGNSSLCPTPPPLEVHSCTVDCCTFVDSVDSTQCDADNCQSWSSQQCFCGDMANSTSGFVGLAPACDLSDCYGVPNENLTDCPGCTPQSDIPLPWQTQPEPQPQPPTCAWRFLSTSDCSGSCDSVVVLNPTPSNQTTSSVVAAGVQVTTRACFCGNQQVAPGNCPNDYTVFTKQTCSIACTCSWVNATSWSTCNSGKRYYTRKCNCSDLICPNTSSSTSSSKRNYGKDKDDQKSNYGKDKDDQKSNYGKDKDHQNYGKDNDDHKSTYGKDKDNQKPTSSNPPSSLPQSTYSFACGGYDVVIEDCSSSAPPTDIRNNPTDCDDASSSHSKTSKKHKREVEEEFLGEKESDDLQKNPEAPSLLVVIIPVVVVSILVTAAAILIIIKSRNDNRS